MISKKSFYSHFWTTLVYIQVYKVYMLTCIRQLVEICNIGRMHVNPRTAGGRLSAPLRFFADSEKNGGA